MATNLSYIASQILDAIEESGKDIKDHDLRGIQDEYISFIDEYAANSSGCVYLKVGNHVPNLGKPDAASISNNERIVIIGDLHSDFEALKGILLKLICSEYDYPGKAVFVFLGDYLDRGFKPFQTLRLLFRFRQIIGQRCIFLKGNHDGFYYNRANEVFYPLVKPADSIEMMFHLFEAETMEKFKIFFDILPYFVLAQVNERFYFITHGGIPKDSLTNQITFENLHLVRLPFSSKKALQSKVYKALKSLTWGDPVAIDYFRDQDTVRFEFGSLQFERFKESFGFTHLVRGHEPICTGFQSFYNEQLFTIFSTGGKGNRTSYYSNLVTEPCFGIIDEEGILKAERIFQ